MVFAVALNLTGNYADSEDVVQETFLRAYEKLRTLSDPSRFPAWLYRIARRAALRFLRTRAKHVVLTSSDEDALELEPVEPSGD